MLDQTDLQILKALTHNCRLKVSHLAQRVHLTAPAVTARINRLEDTGVIKRYTIEVDTEKLGYDRQIFIRAAVKDATQRPVYRQLIKDYRNDIRHHYRVSGDMPYLIEGAFHSRGDLNDFLLALGEVATYKVIDVIDELI
ncbi:MULTISPECIES: Lrp/AsnC family transcriptional regulator [Lactobacillaceae]|uniref:Lrp/AsnC family transcriptional regulator n=1 Tax=Lactobacillaceae TaxID=33958 RepID=UPI00145687E6|nr:Lrp/AsnC family transcriptional regulator [Lactobacillus sp. HBUAS51381]NLR10754.1 Lrp/AsnC family transcriptional regulator [Lactobacillus sp. HBUAS51381]